MKQEKFNIKFERQALRCDTNGGKSLKEFPQTFGTKKENNFITAGEDESILNIKTPSCTSVSELYNKLEEITNVVLLEIYNNNEIIWPCSEYSSKNEKIEQMAKLNITIDKEYYEEIKGVDCAIPDEISDAYKMIEKEFKKKAHLIESIFGKCIIKSTKNSITISNIKLNASSKCGITENDLLVLVTFIFSCLKDTENTTLKDELKALSKLGKNYSLKSQGAIKELEKEIKEKISRTEKEEKLSFEEKLQLALDQRLEGYNCRYCLQKYNKLASESVVIIKDAISQGIDYKVLNEAKSVVEFNHNGHKEFVIEGNKTDRDSYIFPIITDDKFTSKQIMAGNGLNVPKAILLSTDMDNEDIESLVKPFYNKCLVVKPRNTNYGIGITVFGKPATRKQILNAIEYAFKFDTNILIEEYKKGMEYRFLVIDGKCLSVAHRRIASVVGDGKSTIRELIERKNKEPWHFLTATPVKMDEPVVEYLKLQGYDFETIIPKDKRVFLRTNSNCSTGGESIDMTDVMPDKFKKIAERAAKSFDAKICGVDIIIEDFKKDDYAIIEINDNPGYSINEWPYEGRGEKIGLAILKLLGYKLKAFN